MKKIYGLLFLVLMPALLHAQAPAIEWERCYGGTYDDQASCIIQTTDGGYVMVGSSTSDDFDIKRQENHYALKNDFWVVKTSAQDSIEWQVMLGGTDEDIARSVVQTYDGGYLVTGDTRSNDGDVDGYHLNNGLRESDYWVVKLDNKGVIEWQKPLGGLADDGVAMGFQTADSNYLIAGYASSTDGDVTGGHDGPDLWVVKLGRTGSLLWEKCVLSHSVQPLFSGAPHTTIRPFIPTSDGGFALTGIIDTSGVYKADGSAFDGIIIKFNDTGAIEWTHVLGGKAWDALTSITQTKDGGYALAGFTTSNTEETPVHGMYDFWVLKLNKDGNFEWQKSFGGSGYDVATSIIQTKDGGYAITGWTESNDVDIKGFHGGSDFWLVKLNSFGVMEWQKAMGGSNYDNPFSLIQTKDGGYAIAGITASSDGDVTGMHGENDYWVVKLKPAIAVSESSKQNDDDISIFPNPENGIGKISYTLTAPSTTKIGIFNSLGEKLRSLLVNKEDVGRHEQEFDISGLPAGSYFFRIETEGKSVVKGIRLIK